MQRVKEKISIIIPVYNEADRIYHNLEEIKDTFDGFGCKYEIIVCNDGSKDSTVAEVNRFISQHESLPIKLILNKRNYGKGRTLKKGFKYTSGEYIIFCDGDLDLHPSQIPTFFDIMKLNNADIVIGSKRHPNSVLYYPFNRRFMSLVYFSLVKLMFGLPISDTQTGLKLFKKEALKDVFRRILVKKFAFDLELLVNAHHLNYKIVEAPIFLNHQREFQRIGFMSIFNMVWDTLAIWYRMYILKYYDSIDYYRRKGMLRQFKKYGNNRQVRT